MKRNKGTILFVGGGTGGHIYPGLAVLDKMPGEYAYVWLGSRKSMDREIVEGKGIPFKAVSAGKLRRYFSLENLVDVFKILLGFFESLMFVARTRPKALFSKGGYVSVPPVVAARLLKIPVITHESDLLPGLATKINSRYAEKILVAYEESIAFFPLSIRQKLTVAGVPIRPEVLTGDPDSGRRSLSLSSSDPILLVLGGSQGARAVNSIILNCIDKLLGYWQVIHQTGKLFSIDKEQLERLKKKGYRPAPYFGTEYPDILAAADVVICRAGATTLWELSAVKKPSVLIPLGLGASRGDQISNARLYYGRGASFVLESGDGAEKDLIDLLEDLKDVTTRAKMGEMAHSLYREDSAIFIAAEIIKSATGE